MRQYPSSHFCKPNSATSVLLSIASMVSCDTSPSSKASSKNLFVASTQTPKRNWNNAGKKHRHESTAAALSLIMLLSNMTQRNLFTLQNSLTILPRSLLRFYSFWILWLFTYRVFWGKICWVVILLSCLINKRLLNILDSREIIPRNSYFLELE